MSPSWPAWVEYKPGTTYVGSTVEDLFVGGAGVCQDFVHLAVILLRRQGIAARYVSGYLWAAPQDGGSDSVEVDTHAWVEALLPASGGRGEPVWVGADPTNRILVTESHLKIGHGRFYADVPPIKGVYRGSADVGLDDAPGSGDERPGVAARRSRPTRRLPSASMIAARDCFSVIVETRDLDTDARTRQVIEAHRPSAAVGRRTQLQSIVAEFHPDAKIRSFADGVASFLAPQHLIVARYDAAVEGPIAGAATVSQTSLFVT